MGKAAKAHRAKVLKRNRDRQHIENKMKKEWNAAFEEQMAKMINENLKIKMGSKTKKMIDVNGNEVEVYDDTQPEDKGYSNLLSNEVLRGVHSVSPAEKKFTLDEFMKGYNVKDNATFNEMFEPLNSGNCCKA